ncbi:hypothetical protein ACI2KG_03140 [Pseudomonas sp. NPDC089407]|uniref:hypothetical protein n=1 Tax=Pseudomonas sp. NPDC089407 TaxID=3364464 RepID=UPI00384F3997
MRLDNMRKIATTESYSFSEKTLLGKIHDFISRHNFDTLHVMAGHFMLFYDPQGKHLVPGIFEDIQNPVLQEQVKSRVGIFPTYTWKLAIKLAELQLTTNNISAKFILLINDWQYIPGEPNDTDYRAEFYKRFTKLPDSYLSLLEASNIISTNNLCQKSETLNMFP